MPRPPTVRATGGSKKGDGLGAKHELPAGKTEWIFKFKDLLLEIVIKQKGILPGDNEVYRRLKRKYKTKTPAWTTLRRWRAQGQKVKEGNEAALAFQARSGRPCGFTDTHQQQIDDALWDNKWLSDVQLAKDLKVGLKAAKKYKKLAGWCTVHTRRITLLNIAHKAERDAFCKATVEKELRHRGCGDEKVFVDMPPATMSAKLEDKEYADSLESDSEEEEDDLGTPKKPDPKKKLVRQLAAAYVDDKQQPVKIMMTAFVVRPVPHPGNKTFIHDGKIGIWPSKVTMKEAQKKSKNHEKGDVYPVYGGSVDHEAYTKVMLEKVLPALDEYAETVDVDEVEFQDDNATPHKKAWPAIAKACEDRDSGVAITKVKQPPRSPDLNPDDLYVWQVLAPAVNRQMWTVYRNEKHTHEMLLECINHAWENDLTPAKIECAFRLMKPVMKKVIECGGGNNFRIPHTGIRAQMRAEGWDI